MQKLNYKYLIPGLILFAGILIFIMLRVFRPESPPVTIRERVWPVKTLPAHFQFLAPTLTLYGQIETPALVKATAPDRSHVIAISVREGNPISKNQLLLSLDPRDFQPKIIQAEARVAELKALIESERLRYQADKDAYQYEAKLIKLEQAAVKRVQMLKNKNLSSTAALEQTVKELEKRRLSFTSRKLSMNDHKARSQQLEARLAYAQAELDLTRLDFERSQIIAPFDGFVEKVDVAAGEPVKENQVLLSFYPLDQLEVRAKIPATYIHELQQALQQGQKLSAVAHISGQDLHLQLERLAGAADATGIDALFSITENNDQIRLGSMLTLTLRRPFKERVIAIPFAAIYDNDLIYILKNDRLQGIEVRRIGEYADKNGSFNLLIASQQIKAGTPIVITHLPNAVTGLRVTMTDSKPVTE